MGKITLENLNPSTYLGLFAIGTLVGMFLGIMIIEYYQL